VKFFRRTAPLAIAATVLLGITAPAPADAASRTTLKINLTGQAVTDAGGDAGDENGRGQVRITLQRRGGDSLICWKYSNFKNVDLSDDDNAIATLFQGAEDEIDTGGSVELGAPNSRGRGQGCTDVDADFYNDIRDDPAGFYVSIANEGFPNGAVRGQLR